MMRQVAEDGSSGAAVWWWPGGASLQGSDFGIVDPGGTLRPCGQTLARWNATFTAAAPDATAGPVTKITVDRDADARGEWGLFDNVQGAYVQAKQAGQSVVLIDAGTGTDTATMPVIQVGNVPYDGSGPLKYAGGEVASIHATCPGVDAVVENGSTLAIAPGASCSAAVSLVNTGEAKWLAGSASRGVTLHTNIGDVLLGEVASLQGTTAGPLAFTIGQNGFNLTGRLHIAGVGDFGDGLNVRIDADASAGSACSIGVNPSASFRAPSSATSGSVAISTGSTCAWTVSTDQPWITFDSTTGTGSGSLHYSMPLNYGPVRQAAIRVGATALIVTQDGIAPFAQAPAPGLATTSLSFSGTPVGSASAAQTATITNPGPGDLTIAGVFVGGLNSGDFSTSGDCSKALRTGQQCTIQVTFSPSAAGERTATLSVAGVGSTTSLVQLAGSGTLAAPVPAIQAIVDAWGYTSGIAPGLWVTIGGTNLGALAQVWNLNGVQMLPVGLGATRVTFNGVPAPLLYVSPTQINALVPSSVTAGGSTDVVVQVNGVPSAPFQITARAAHPAVYAPPTSDGSTFFVTAALAGTGTLIGNSATDARVLRAAYAGEALDLYMIGLGATQDASKFLTDQVFAGGYPVSATVTATVGGKRADVLFSGLTGPGLYLVRVVVPTDVGPGSQALEISADGIQTRSALTLQVGTRPN